jgi:RNA-directed DNA polymerase
VVRYADDYVVFCCTKREAEQATATLTAWLAERGLTLSTEKTRIVHLKDGFDFLGFSVNHYRVTDRVSGYKLLIRPSKQAVREVKIKLRELWKTLHGHAAATVIRTLNPVIGGWATYSQGVVSTKTFQKLDAWMYRRCVRSVRRMHPTKSWKWTRHRYWAAFIRSEQTSGSVVTAPRAAICSGSRGTTLCATCWSRAQHHQMTHE